MISDILSDAVRGIRQYLDDPAYASAYPPGEPLTERIRACTAEMEAIRDILDAAPHFM